MPTVVKRFSPVIATAILILLVAGLQRHSPDLSIRSRTSTPSFAFRYGAIWPSLRQYTPAFFLVSLLVVILASYPESSSYGPGGQGERSVAPVVSSRGGFRLPEMGVLGATPPPVPVILKPVGPPSPDPVQLAAARLALTPTPTPVPIVKSTETATEWRRELGVFRVTGYSDSPLLNGTDGRGITKSGARTRWGCVAVDPRVIPLGTHLLIEGYEGTVFTALDTGGGINGRWIDIWFPTDWDALQHGLQELSIAIVGEN